MTMMEQSVPQRSLEQRMDALASANRIRSFRARLKKDLKAGREEIADWLAEPVHEDIESMRLFELLLALPKVGRVKANKTLQVVRASPSKTVGGLSVRQRAELAGVLAGRRRTMGSCE